MKRSSLPFAQQPAPRTTTRLLKAARTGALALLFANAGVSIAAAEPATATPKDSAKTASEEPAPAPKSLGMAIRREQLQNGLRVVLNEDHSSPTVAVCVTYDVGSRNEEKGRSGFAHLFEHMMFQGSRNVGKGDHFMHISSRGGSLNGTTSSDRTNYYELVPANALTTALWLEADRMKTLAVTEENFENQRQVVQEEYRMRVSNNAYAEGHMLLNQLVFKDYWPYEHDPIGSMVDLDNAKLEWIRDFHRAYYAPNNAVLSIAGDFEPEATLEYVRRFFSDAKPTDVPPYAPPEVPTQTEQRRTVVTDANAKTPGYYLGYMIPPARHPEHYALELATLILSYGDSSVLHQRLVQGTGQLRDIATWTRDRRGPDSFVIRALLSEGVKIEDIEREILTEIDRFATSGPTLDELTKAKEQLQSFFLFGLEGNQARAIQLANYELFYGDAALLNTELNHYLRVTPQDVMAAVARHLTKPQSSVVVVLPDASAPKNPTEGN